MSYKRPEHTTMTRLPKRGRDEYYLVEGFLNKEEAQQYADYYYQSNWGMVLALHSQNRKMELGTSTSDRWIVVTNDDR